jgi:mono/diheme cytochrome c family protein
MDFSIFQNNHNRKGVMKIRTLFSLTGFLLLAGGLFVWFGGYNVAATDEHWPITTELLEVVRERSIQVRSESLVQPDPVSSQHLARGAEDYAAMCVQCHLAPGQEATELHRGLYPRPPVFHETDHTAHNPGANFWVIKNGLKMTGMPAWGPVHSDEEIWAMVAFIEQLPEMSEEEYQQAAKSAGDSSGGHHDESSSQHSH